jgi:hypothetical protein
MMSVPELQAQLQQKMLNSTLQEHHKLTSLLICPLPKQQQAAENGLIHFPWP